MKRKYVLEFQRKTDRWSIQGHVRYLDELNLQRLIIYCEKITKGKFLIWEELEEETTCPSMYRDE